jgi:hypothetical protein
MALGKTTHVRGIRHTGSRVRRADPKNVAKALGAAVDHRASAIKGSALSTTALRQEVFSQLASSGGRPGL